MNIFVARQGLSSGFGGIFVNNYFFKINRSKTTLKVNCEVYPQGETLVGGVSI
jgi:hypothetical protein